MADTKSIPFKVDSKIENRFWSKVSITAQKSLCWEWNGWVRDNKKPYGRFLVEEIIYSAHRIAYYLHYKEDPKEMHVLHKCDNPRCVNPEHLFLGTNEDNVRDKVSKGRQALNKGMFKGIERPYIRGSNNTRAVLNEEKVKQIKLSYAAGGVTSRDLGKTYGVSKTSILFIINNKQWKHVTI